MRSRILLLFLLVALLGIPATCLAEANSLFSAGHGAAGQGHGAAAQAQGAAAQAPVTQAQFAALQQSIQNAQSAGDNAWVLVSAALVLLMTGPGLTLFYGGLVRRKNILSVLMQCFMCMGLVTVIWMVFGFSMAFGPDCLGGFIGNPLAYPFLKNLSFEKPWTGLTISEQMFMAFQCMFAVITPGLIIGAFAERMKFAAFTVFTAVWLVLVYCPIAHWVWGGADGFFGLGKEGALDFAGGTVIHINAGIAALVACLVMGKRQGFPNKISPPHNLPFAVLGAGLLWFGWFGFNAGSAASAGDQAVRAFVVTHIAAASAGLAWSFIEWFRNGHPTVLGMITGAVAGLVAITPASGYVDPSGALIIGVGTTIASYIFVAVLKPIFGYDDSLDVFGVHGISGIFGALATGIFAVKGYGIAGADGKGLGGVLEGNTAQLFVQAKAVVFTIVYSGVMSYVILKVLDVVMGLRATEHNERVGLDLTDHAETAYTVIE